MSSAMTLGGKLMFPTEFVAAVELGGRDVTLTISAVVFEDLQVHGGQKERRVVIRFAEMDTRPTAEQKRFVCNKTNGSTIAGLYGSEARKWVGKRITLFATTCSCMGQTVDCIRVRATKPAGRRAQPSLQDNPADLTDLPQPDEYDPETGEISPEEEEEVFGD